MSIQEHLRHLTTNEAVDQIRFIYDFINTVKNINNENFETIQLFILGSPLIKSKYWITQFLHVMRICLCQFPKRQRFYLKLIILNKNIILNFLNESEIYSIFKFYFHSPLYILYKEGLLSLEYIFKCFTSDLEMIFESNRSVFLMFFSEIIQNNNTLFINEDVNSFAKIYENRDKDHLENCLNGYDDPIMKIMIEDDIESFKRLIDQKKIDFNKKIKRSIYSLVQGPDETALINCAAECGSLKIYSYLHSMVDIKCSMLGLFRSALMGGNENIIFSVENKIKNFGRTFPIADAIVYHQNDEVKYLIGTRNIKMEYEDYILSIEIMNYEIFINYFYLFKKRIITQNFTEMNSIPHLCCKYNAFPIVKYLCSIAELKFNKVCTSRYQITPFDVSIENDNFELFEYLVKTENFPLNGYVLFFVCSTGRVRFIKFVLDYGKVDINSLDCLHHNILHKILEKDDLLDALAFICDQKDLDINCPDSEGLTPVFWAVLLDNKDVLEILARNDRVDWNHVLVDGPPEKARKSTPLTFAIYNAKRKSFEFLLNFAKVNLKTTETFDLIQSVGILDSRIDETIDTEKIKTILELVYDAHWSFHLKEKFNNFMSFF